MTDRVVRSLGSDKTHVVNVSESALESITSFGAEFTGIAQSVNTRCATALRGPIVCMQEGTTVRCAQCKRLTGIISAGPNNTRRNT